MRVAAALAVVALVAACIFLPGVADRAFYAPLPQGSGLPGDPTFRTTTARIPNGDAVLSSWVLEPLSGKPKATVVFAHGNGGNMQMNQPFIGFLPKYGFRVVCFDYQGFGDSTGSPPTRFTTHSDVLAAIDFAYGKWGKVWLMGHSLGAALVISTAPERKDSIRGVLAMAPFSSYRAMGRLVMGHIPLVRSLVWPIGFFVRRYKDPIDMAAGIAPVPLFIIHGEKDELIPPSMAEEIYNHAGDPKQMLIVPKMTHGSSLDNTDPKVLQEAIAFLSQKES
jgi:uncharacterized protein